MNIQQIRAALPTHIMLTPGAHRWREGDKAILSSGELISVCGEDIGQKVDCASVRPIPPHILDNQAWWVWFKGPVDEISNKELRERHYGPEYNKRVNEGRLYDKWLFEQME